MLHMQNTLKGEVGGQAELPLGPTKDYKTHKVWTNLQKAKLKLVTEPEDECPVDDLSPEEEKLAHHIIN